MSLAVSDPIKELLDRGTAEIIRREHLENRLKKWEKGDKPLRIKLGIDPTGSVLHIGHAVVLRKLRQFQDLGHTIIFLIGDFTARIGDPTGRSVERKPLSNEDICSNMKTYVDQASLILDFSKVELHYNSEWLKNLSFTDVIALTSRVTFAQVAQRADFKERIKNDQDLSLQEFIYPVMQGYDSVELHADVEMGGTDQKFNLLMGRQIQERYNQPPQDIVTVPILEGLDGHEKMSKSLNNYIGITEDPSPMYAKVMSIPDSLIVRYFELATDVPSADLDKIRSDLKSGVNPRDLKMRLAREIVTLYHSSKAASQAEEQFVLVFQKKSLPNEIPEKIFKQKKICILDLLFESGLASSKSDARRLIDGGGVRLDSERVSDLNLIIQITNKGVLIQVGKRRFLRAKAR